MGEVVVVGSPPLTKEFHFLQDGSMVITWDWDGEEKRHVLAKDEVEAIRAQPQSKVAMGVGE